MNIGWDYVTKNVGGPNYWIIAEIFLWKQLKSQEIFLYAIIPCNLNHLSKFYPNLHNYLVHP
jgi:hypothetical protein